MSLDTRMDAVRETLDVSGLRNTLIVELIAEGVLHHQASTDLRRKDEAARGHYRTKATILQIYDAMSAAMRTGQPYQSLLDPPPADPSLAHDPSTRPEWM